MFNKTIDQNNHAQQRHLLWAILAAIGIAIAAPAAQAQDNRPRAALSDYTQVAPGDPLPIDGVWRLRELGKQVIIENGVVIAMEEWTHLFIWVVEPGMVTSSRLRQTDRQKLVAYDELLQREMEWTLREDGTLFASGGEGLLDPKFSLAPVELSYPGAFEAMRIGEEIVLTEDGFAGRSRPDPMELPPEMTSPIRSGDGMCLDLHGPDEGKQGGRMQVWECLGGANQNFIYLEDDGLIVTASGMCLEAVGPDNGAPVRVFGCDGNPAQIWSARSAGVPGAVSFVNENTGRCLDAHGPESKTNGGRIQLWDCFAGNNQSWSQ